ncbi:hypothetical protein QBC44DRAFT_311223 [Cladorrhinum sp. PSN332]|nr:hypothetical protein QBC44DRAFT_311223 [Cladorrhinum sp. PSN332]
MDNFSSALTKWKKVGSDYDHTFYAHDNDKNGLYALIDLPAGQIENYLPSAKTVSTPRVVFIKKSDTLLLENVNTQGYYFTDKLKTKTQKKINAIEEESTGSSAAHPDGEILWTRLSTDTMEQPYTKSKRPWNQEATMGGTLATDAARKLGWRGNAEGGLASMFEPASMSTTAPSQQPLNFCIGTPQCNTHMLRWEKAWQNLFHKEKSLSGTAVKGSLLVCNNEHIKVAPPRRTTDAHYPRESAPITFDEYGLGNNNDWSLAMAWSKLGFLVFVMEYEVTLDGSSKILECQTPKSDVQFHPFRRQFNTRTECLLDDILFEGLLARQNFKKTAKK